MHARVLIAVLASWIAGTGLIGGVGLIGGAECRADVFVLANRTPNAVDVRVSPLVSQPYRVRLASGEVRPLYCDDGLSVSFDTGAGSAAFSLRSNAAYYFASTTGGRIGLTQIGLGATAATESGRTLPGEAQPKGPVMIPVRLLVDDEEPLRREVWEKKLRDRAAAASEVLIRHSGIGLRVVDVGVWRSDNEKLDFNESLAEFEQLVNPEPARLAIGFTSQYEVTRGRVHLGGTRGPLRGHILLREWSSKVSERERMELLVHELGHFLGATHSPESDSVMRPLLGDRQARRKGFSVRFDPVNTLIISMVGEEIRRRGVDRFGGLTRGTRLRLGQVYGAVGQTMPKDASTKRFQQLTRVSRETSPTENVRRVLRAITASARQASLAPKDKRPAGDDLTQRYVRAAAAEANKLSGRDRPKAFLLALGIAMDDSTSLRTLPPTKKLVLAAEPPSAREARLKVLGDPTVEGRRDLAKHFFLSAHLTAASTGAAAYQLGLMKETLDAQRHSGFSFADIAANRAGIRFAESVLAGRPPLARLASDFRLALYMPSIKDLPEGLTSEEFTQQFGGPNDPRFQQQLTEINTRINNLPAYMVFDLSF